MFVLGCLAFIIAPVFAWELYRYLKTSNAAITHMVSGTYSIAMLILFMTCLTRIYPGEVGVVVDMMGMHQGVDQKVLTVGVHGVLPWQEIYHFPIYQQNHQWEGEEGFSFQTSEGLSVHADIGISYELEEEKVPDLFKKYRQDIKQITHIFVRNNIRDAINKVSSRMKIEELYGEKKEEFFRLVLEHVKNDLMPLGFKINSIFIMGQFRVPEIVMEALNRKIEATQKAQQRENELREAEAQARKEIAKSDGEAKSKIIKAKGDAEAIFLEAKARADSNRLLTQSLSKELIQWEYVNKWNGELPKITSESGGLMLQLPFDPENKK